MFRRRLYYALKPYLPRDFRVAVRRYFAKRKRAATKNIWPIDEAAGTPPPGWPGWPEGRKFAFVITHDVEQIDGLDKCRQLAEIELELGFRSSFNFIPEGPYRVPAELRAWLVENGFEVGLHDLNHDGKLFDSREGFKRKAARINEYAREWNAVGFRSGFMLRNLEWMHALDVEYEASTFDTDPFEPQPDGVGTIFPFWIQRPAELGSMAPLLPPEKRRGTGYVELPYTLPQDSTLFFVLGETSPDIWLRKLDWIAERGGMALVNIHPDYVRFDGEAPSNSTYSVEHYRRLLTYIRDRYAADCWRPLPREIAAYTRSMTPRPTLRRPKRVCMITHSYYESDNRVTRYASSLAARGDHVDVVALRRSPDVPAQEVIDGVNVFRLQERYGRGEKSKLDYFRPWARFLRTSARWLREQHQQRPYDFIHVHNMPDFLVFAARYPRKHGAKVLLDIHDIVPEFYGSKFGGRANPLVFAFLKWLERRSARFAHHIIVSNDLWRDTFAKRTGTDDRCSVFINNVDSGVFQPQPRTRQDDRQIIIFPGGLQWHQGLDLALRAFVRVHRELPSTEFHIYGDGNVKNDLIALAGELGLNGSVRFFDPVPMHQVAQLMANADLGVVPKRADSFGNEAYSTKIMEFMALGVPVVVSRTKIDQFYFNENVVRFFESGNVDELSQAMLDVLRNPALRERLVTNAAAYARTHSWDTRKHDYFNLVDNLAARK
jgi:glycosyltransferase involved in cell wall biosynthesis